MAEPSRHTRTPLVLIINDQEWSTRSLESILAPNGYAVLRAYTGAKGVERALAAHPDIIVVGASLPDAEGIEVCRRLREECQLPASTPILMSATGRPSRNERLAAYRLGAWDYLGQPLDAEELLLKFDVYVRAKQDADRARAEGLIDGVTGLYSLAGLARRARELGSLAFRHHGPLACIVFSAQIEAATEREADETVRALSQLLRSTGRASDAVGRIGELEFAIFAPETGLRGAQELAERVSVAMRRDTRVSAVHLASGFHAVEDLRSSGLEPADLLEQATAALKAARGPRAATVN